MPKLLIPVVLITLFAFNLGCSRTAPTVTPTVSPSEETTNDTSTGPELSLSGEAIHTIVVGATASVDPVLHPLMLGVISGPQISSGSEGVDVTEQYQDVGVTAVRNNDYWDDRLDIEGIFNCGGDTYPSWEGCDANDDSNYDWTKSDLQYQAWIDGGFVPFLRIGGEMKNSLNPHDFSGPQNTTQEDNWIIAANKMIDRYEHWNGEPSAFTYLDIWTEIPGNSFWDRSDQDFMKFWVKAYKSIKAAHPELKVGGPGFIGVKLLEGKDRLATGILNDLYKQGLELDWLGWHTFGTDPTKYSELATTYQNLLEGAGQPWAGTGYFSNTEVIVDAYGNGSGTAPVGGEVKISVNTGEGAAVLTSGWIALQYANIQGAFYYRGNDYGTTKEKAGTTGSFDDQAGLFTSAGEYKPLAHAFKLWSTLTNNYPTLLSTNLPADGSTPDLWAMAAQNSEGNIALLVANPSTTATTFTIQANGQDLSSFPTAIAYEVDDNNDGTAASLLTTSTISLPAGAVELIELRP